MVLPPQNPRFFGRRDILDQLREKLEASPLVLAPHSVTLQGIGGVGKTSIALQFAHLSKASKDSVMWIQSETQIALAQSFTQAARELHLPDVSEGDHTNNRLIVLEWLRDTGMSDAIFSGGLLITHPDSKWLVVFDNVEDAEHVGQYILERGNGAILLTTRKPNLGYGLTESELEITPFSAKEGTECILELATWQRGGERDNISASELNNRLGGLPLGITQMVALMRAKAMSIKLFITLYEQNRKTWHGQIRRGGRHIEYKHDLNKEWQLSFRTLDDSPSAMSLLGILCFLSPSSIPQALFKKWGDTDAKRTESLLWFCNKFARFDLSYHSKYSEAPTNTYNQFHRC